MFQAEVALENFQDATNEDLLLERDVLKILRNKCDFCHQRKNPFLILKEQNISRITGKSYQMVFVEQSMPKGIKNRLTKKKIVS